MALAFSFNFNYFGLSYPGGLGSSVILGDLDRKNYMEKLISFLDPVLLNSQRSGFVRCWHAKTDGLAASTFHSNCDGKGPTVTIIKSGNYIFGGYTDVSWHSSTSFKLRFSFFWPIFFIIYFFLLQQNSNNDKSFKTVTQEQMKVARKPKRKP